ncbi:MAG: mandelate racemase/muconate lactonizing enzyme family protein [Pirellulales bacterium]|nr:mandelate racemase/muconate lactonizing enzyme family protein [Pirellulales bacterium]
MPIKINDLDLLLVELPCEAGPDVARCLLARLTSDSGLEGWGEVPSAWKAEELASRREMLLSVLPGRGLFDVEDLLRLDVLAEPALRCAIEMACWDLIGQALKQPLCHLWGGNYRRRVPLAVRLPQAGPDETSRLARELAEQGFHSQVLTSTGNPADDARLVTEARRATSDRAELRLDGCQGYDLATARDLCAELEYERLACFVDPLQASTLHDVAALGRQTSVPLGVCRAIGRPADVLVLARTEAGRFALIDPARVGGLAAVRRCAAVAEAGGLSAALACGPSPGVAAAAMLHLAASTPVLASANECAYQQFREDLLTDPLEILDGMVAVPQSPGLGVRPEREKLERFQIA